MKRRASIIVTPDGRTLEPAEPHRDKRQKVLGEVATRRQSSLGRNIPEFFHPCMTIHKQQWPI
jgi:hypothetical protein